MRVGDIQPPSVLLLGVALLSVRARPRTSSPPA
jgi:hypothetical protein